MKCPECEEKLHPSGMEQYETLSEHVIDPNQYLYNEPPPRVAYRCRNKCYPHRVFFSPDGSVYSPPPKWFQLLAKTKWDWIWRFYPHLKTKDALQNKK